MTRYVVSIRPEHRQTWSPSRVLKSLQELGRIRVVEGSGRATMTIEAKQSFDKVVAREIPEVTIRVYRPLELLS